MQNLLKVVFTGVFIGIISNAFSFQDSTRLKKDTLRIEKTIQFTPYYSKEKLKSFGNYIGVVDDSLSFQFSSGISVLNTLRGQVPNIGISPNAQFATALQNSLFVIDGLPYQSEISSYYNMNSFDYSSIALLNRGNAAAIYGGTGANGALILKSKTGENQLKPTVEFNSYSTLSWYDIENINSDSETTKQWYLSNSVAYMQDFGKIDTRVSYNFLSIPPTSGFDRHSNGHNFKINTGFDLNPKFNARLIVDNLYTKSSYSSSAFNQQQGMVVPSEGKTNNNFLQGNLILRYQPLKWLTLTSQNSLGKIDYESGTKQANAMVESDLNQDRFLSNFFTSFNRDIISKLSFTTFAGFQYEKVEVLKSLYQLESQLVSGFIEEKVTLKTRSFLAGLGLNYNEFLFSNFNYRLDGFSSISNDNNQKPTYAFSTAFIFSDAFDWSGSFFSFGKIRSSVGKSNLVIDHYYPYRSITTSIPYIPSGPHTSKNSFEVGTDLFFAKDKIMFTLNYFDEKNNDNYLSILIPGSTGYSYQTLNVGSLRSKGTEIIVKAIPIKRNNIEYQTTLIWMTSKTKIENIPGIINGNAGNPNSAGGSLGNSNPSWTGSLLNQITWKYLAFSFLIDIRKGGDFISRGSNNILTTDEGSQMKLRDVSMGYQFAPLFLNKVGFKQAQVSISARNALLIYAKSDDDVEDYSPGTTAQKSASLSLSLLF